MVISSCTLRSCFCANFLILAKIMVAIVITFLPHTLNGKHTLNENTVSALANPRHVESGAIINHLFRAKWQKENETAWGAIWILHCETTDKIQQLWRGGFFVSASLDSHYPFHSLECSIEFMDSLMFIMVSSWFYRLQFVFYQVAYSSNPRPWIRHDQLTTAIIGVSYVAWSSLKNHFIFLFLFCHLRSTRS